MTLCISKYPVGSLSSGFLANNYAEFLHHCHTCYMPCPSCLPWWALGKKKSINFEPPYYTLFYIFHLLPWFHWSQIMPIKTHTHWVLAYGLPQQHRESRLEYCPFLYTHHPAGMQGIWRQSSACSSCGLEPRVSVQCLFHPLYTGQSTPLPTEASLVKVAKRQIHVSAGIRNLSPQALT